MAFESGIAIIDVHNPPQGVYSNVGTTAIPVWELLEPCVGDGVVDDTISIQRFLDLARSGQPGVVLQFKPGAIYRTTDTLTINAGVGLRIIGGGLPHGGTGHDNWAYYPTIRLDPATTNKTILLISHAAGLVLDGLMLDGGEGDWNTIGQRIYDRNIVGIDIVAGNAGINGAKHHYLNMAISGCTIGWRHDKDAGSPDNYNGDTYQFSHCDFRENLTTILVNTAGDMMTRLDHCAIATSTNAIVYGKATNDNGAGGQLYVDSMFLVFVNRFLQVHSNGANNMGFFVRNLKHDNSFRVYRPQLYIEQEITGAAEQGRTRGPIVFDNIIMSTGIGADGNLQSIDNINDFCQLKLLHSIKAQPENRNAATMRVGDIIHLHNTGVDAYDYPVSGTEFTITQPPFKDTTGWYALTDIPFLSNPGTTGTWWDCSPIFRQRGGSDLAIHSSYFPPSMYKDGSFLRSMNSTWTTIGRGSSFLGDRLYGLPQPDVTAVGQYITFEDPENANVDPFYRFTDCRSEGIAAPWFESNYETSKMWTDAEMDQIRYRLGLDGARTTPASNYAGSIPATLDSQDTLLGTMDSKLDNIITIVSAISPDGSTDWTTTERNEIRFRLALTGAHITPAVNDPNSIPAQNDTIFSNLAAHDATVNPKLDALASTQQTILTNIATIDDKIDAQDILLISMDSNIDSIGAIVSSTNSIVTSIDTQLDTVESKQDQTLTDLTTIQAQLDTIESAISSIDTAQGRDWTDSELQQLRYRLAINGVTAVPTSTPRTSIAGLARISAAANAGLSSGAGTTSETFKDVNTDQNVFTASYDENDNRVAVTYNDA